MNRSVKTVFGVVTAATVLVMGMATAYADTEGTEIPPGSEAGKAGRAFVMKGDQMPGDLTLTQMQAVMTETNAQMKTELAKLVETGVITQDIADRITSKGTMIKERPERPELTEEQKAEMDAKKQNTDRQRHDFSALTEEEKAELKAKMDAMKEERGEISKGERAYGVKLDLTEEQQQALRSAMDSAHKAAVEKLVSEGTITQEQADQMTAVK